MATYAWMLDKKGIMYSVDYHYYVNDDDLFESALECAMFIAKVSDDEKTYGTSYDMLNYCVASDIYDNAIEDEDMIKAINELYSEGLESFGIEKELAIKSYNKYKPYDVDTLEEYIDNFDKVGAANGIKEALNNGFIRMRLGGMVDSDNVDGGEMIYRISSKRYNWADVIYQNVHDNKNKYKIKSVTICRDAESDFGFGSNEHRFYKNRRGEEYNQVPVNEFLSGEFDSNPYFEKKNKKSEEKSLYESLEDDFDEFDLGDNDAEWYASVDIPKECLKGATLLSKEEYERYKNNIPLIEDLWWLSSAGDCNINACVGNIFGGVDDDCNVDSIYLGVRPALILNLQHPDIKIGDKFEFGEHLFTILSNSLAICNDFIGEGCFRKDYKSPDANVYEKSDVKKVVDNWFNNAVKNY